MPEPGNPQGFNRYSYVRNSPLNYIDPTGHALESNGGGGNPPERPPEQPPEDYAEQVEWCNAWIRWLRYTDGGPDQVTITAMKEWREGARQHLLSYDWESFVQEIGDMIMLAAIPVGMVMAPFGGVRDELAAPHVQAPANVLGDPDCPGCGYQNPYGQAVNSRGQPYPNIVDPRTGDPIPFPNNPQRVENDLRVDWTKKDRGAFISEWYERGYPEPAGGWGEYDIHHIRPLKFGGDNSFWNLVPVHRETHQRILNPWWTAYP